MNRMLCILWLSLALAPCALAQTAPLDRAQILGELAQGQSASYLAHEVQTRGVDFAPTADFFERVRLSGGEGILIERLAEAEPSAGTNASKSERPFDRLAKCSELIHIGAVEQAVPECRAALDENPESAWPTLLLVRVLSETGITPEERVKLLRRAADADPNLVNVHRALAMEDLPAEERDQEMQKVDTLEREVPSAPFGALDASTFDRWTSHSPSPESLTPDKQSELRSYIETTLNECGDLAAAHLAAAFAYVTLAEPDNVRAQLREALRLEPGNPELHMALGRFYRSQHQAEAELAEFRAAVNVAPYQNLPRRYLAEALVRERRIDEAAEQWKDLLSLSPRDLQASHSLILIYLDRHDRSAAIAELRRSLKASSDVAPSEAEFVDARLNDLEWLGHLLAGDREYEKAEQQYAYLLRFKPDSAELHDSLGDLLHAQQHDDGAIVEYREALRLEGDSPTAHRHLADCLLGTQKNDEAIAEYRKALDLDPDDTTSIAMLGVALMRRGELNAAIEQFQQYLALDPKNAEIRVHLAHAHYLNKNYGAAVDELHQVLIVSPEFPAALNELASIHADP